MSLFEKMARFSRSLSTQLQFFTIILSLVGIGFGVKTFFHLEEVLSKADIDTFYNDLIIQFGVAVAANIFVAWAIFKICTHPIREITLSMQDITDGKVDKNVPFQKKKTEIGSMARRVEMFRKNAIEKKELEAKQVEVERRSITERKKMMTDLAEHFENNVGGVIESLNAAITQLDGTSKDLGTIVNTTNQKASTAADATRQTADNVRAVADSSDVLSQSIRSVRDKINQSSTITNNAVNEVEKTVGRVKNLEKAMAQISEVTSMILDIAEQTNLLALNATIEAARAGEAGKGFAVVAGEVKNLAGQTAKATDTITKNIAQLQSETEAVVEAIGSTRDTMQKVREIATEINDAVEHGTSATAEISRNVNMTSRLTENVNDNIKGVSSATIETDKAAGEVVKCVGELKNQTSSLSRNVSKFLEHIRTG